MLHHMPTVSPSSWNPSYKGICPCVCAMVRKTPQISAPSSDNLRLKLQFGLERLKKRELTISETIFCASQRPRQNPSIRKEKPIPQNVDFPPILPKKKKKPFPIPFKKIQKAAREDKKLAQMGIEKPLEPPKNGLLVPDLIPLAYEVLDAWKVLIKGVAQLLHTIPVYGCRRIKHETRFEYDRIPAVVELCIQAGVDIPEYPSRRRMKPIRMIGKKVIDRGGFLEEPKPWRLGNPSTPVDFDTYRANERFPPPLSEDIPRIAQETMDAYDFVRSGVMKLMKKYTVKACGYCSEVHVGPWGHNAKFCGAFKHQWRDGKHGWQDAIVDEVFPPNCVWHVRDPRGPPLRSALKRFYGKAPAVVEVCMQAGAQVPDRYKPMMRLDIIVPESDEAKLVA